MQGCVELKEYREAVAAEPWVHCRDQELRPWRQRAGMALFCPMQMLRVHTRLAGCAAHLDAVNQRHRFVPVAAALPHLLHAVMLLKGTSTAVEL